MSSVHLTLQPKRYLLLANKGILGVGMSIGSTSPPPAEPITSPSVAAPAAPLRPRLNPFAFPSDTDFRLLLLIAAVIGSGLFIYNWVYFALPQSRADVAMYQLCQQQAQAHATLIAIAMGLVKAVKDLVPLVRRDSCT